MVLSAWRSSADWVLSPPEVTPDAKRRETRLERTGARVAAKATRRAAIVFIAAVLYGVEWRVGK